MSSPRITYAQRSDATPEAELSALFSIYRFVLDCRARKEATRPGSPDDAKESEHVRATQSIPKA